MRYADEVVAFLNTNGANIYEVSVNLGLGRTSLRKKLLNIGYIQDNQGCWVFNGPPDQEPRNVDVTKRLNINKRNEVAKEPNKVENTSIYNRILEIDDNKKIRTTIVVDGEQIGKMKDLAKRYKLKISDLYSLALMEFTQKYQG
ncbi:hypothetical protein C0971_16220 [Bacillus methanolicus]|uniref:hypothetical protein n=1 Tax=Bacillus methanolicus TaxID=1471 RepID=UPI00200ECCE2|nr:hypothetical protein [Bacillus methanolicus]UQD53392.1 hypothetical protein C0971_16220 [Bacillus methanolicus]